MLLFNIALVMVAYSGFFGDNVLYGDFVSSDPDTLASPEDILFGPIEDDLQPVKIADVPIITFSWAFITVGLFVAAVLIGKIMNATPSIIAAAMVGSIMVLMYASSRKVFDQLTGSMDSIVLYVAAMIAVGFLFFVIIAIMDYISGQQSG